MEFIYLAIGAGVGAVVVWLWLRGAKAAVMAKLETEREASAASERQHAVQLARMREDAERAAEQLRNDWQQRLEAALAEGRATLAAAREEAEKRQEAVREAGRVALEEERSVREKERERLERQYNERLSELAATRDAQLRELKESYSRQLELFNEQIAAATEQMLKRHTNELREVNVNQMEQIFKPVRENIDRMERSMTESREVGARNTASVEKSIRMLMESNERIGREADRLANALTRKNKTAGNWGELILSELLESQGLMEGEHFDVQQTMRDETGRVVVNEDTGSRMIPDVILHLSDERDIVVDSKVSLTAFVDYQNAESIEEREEAAKRHLTSIKAHINELSAKNYNEYVAKTHKTIDFVIMFVPVDQAIQLAIDREPSLWRRAFEKKVFVAGSQTLIAALRIIDLTWVNVKQERNTKLVMEEARKLINRVNSFYDAFRTVGRRIEEASKSYDELSKKVDGAPQSILSLGRRMEQLGARGKKPLPAPQDE